MSISFFNKTRTPTTKWTSVKNITSLALENIVIFDFNCRVRTRFILHITIFIHSFIQPFIKIWENRACASFSTMPRAQIQKKKGVQKN